MEKIAEVILAAVLGLAIYALLAALPVMWLWNWLMPELFGVQAISFLQALGLLALCGALFKSSNTSNK
jgi:hypothetical protein